MNNLEFEIDANGIGVATLDMPDRAFNVFSVDMINELEALVVLVEEQADSLVGVVITSAKSAFMAGADLAMVQGYTTLRHGSSHDQIRKSFSRLSYVLRRLERVSVPTVAAVNGLALGGGLELAMACHHRVVAALDTPCLGLPEVQLGLLPGAGGTQRLPRLTRPEFAARMLLTGKPVTPQAALDAGLVDQVVDGAQLLDAAKILAEQSQAGARWDQNGWQVPVDVEGVLAGGQGFERLCSLGWVSDEATHLYPAIGAIARCLLDGYEQSFDDGIEVEVEQFLSLMLDPVAGNMVQTSFLSKTAATKRATGLLGRCDEEPKRLALAGRPASIESISTRFAKGYELVQQPAADRLLQVGTAESTLAEGVIGVRSLLQDEPTLCSAEIRYTGAFDRCFVAEVAATQGDLGATALAIVRRLRLIPVVVQPSRPGPSERLLRTVTDWCALHAKSKEERACLSAALDLRSLFELADLSVGESQGFEASHRGLGLKLLMTVALEGAGCLEQGLLGQPADLDVLAVAGLGFPEWTGGPMLFLDGARRGDIAGLDAQASIKPYYPV